MRIKRADVVSYLGVPGSYSYQAANVLFPDAEYENFRSFAEVAGSVNEGKSQVAVIPVENSIAGRVADVHSMMLSLDLLIAEEHLLPIEHCLVAAGNGGKAPPDLKTIKRVLSHPQALFQCKTFIAKEMPNAEAHNTSDTASAVKEVVEKGDPGDVAIGSSFAAETYGGRVLERNIADGRQNTTRFLAFTANENLEPGGDDDITTLIFQVKHVPGALLKALAAFQECGVNLTKLETYMISEDIELPTFYVDVGAGLQEEHMQRALEKLKQNTVYIKLLGTYKASDQRSARMGFLPVG